MLPYWVPVIANLVIPIWVSVASAISLPPPSGPRVLAQAVDPHAEARAASNGALGLVRDLEGKLAEVRTSQKELEARHKEELAGVERLRRQRASWNRDRKLRARRRAAHATGLKLGKLEKRARALEERLAEASSAAVLAIDRELSLGVSETREAALKRARERVAGSAETPRPIRLPDAQIDELADPEELLEQAALIERAEEQLEKELKKLARREKKYKRIAKLRSKRQRDQELGALSGEDVRRESGRVDDGTAAAGARDQAEAQDAPLSPQGTPQSGQGGSSPVPDTGTPQPGTGFEDTGFDSAAVVLADVVDESTADALRRAGQTSDAGTRARAAGRAKKQVKKQLERLRKRRAAIEKRAGDLKR